MKSNHTSLWRSILFVPANSERFLESALKRPTDAIQLDLEDACPPDLKESARIQIATMASRAAAQGYDVIVRINRPWRQLVRDVEACVHPAIQAITLPKVSDAGMVKAVAEMIEECEIAAGLPIGHTRIIAMIEDAEALSQLDAIAQSHPRLYGMIIGAEDLAVSMRMSVEPDSLYVPNVMLVAACRRAGIVPMGFVGSVADYADREAFAHTVQRAAKLGFEGAFCIHPSQVDAANAAFSPDQAAVKRARELLTVFERERAAGRAVCTFEGRMVDAPVVSQAQLTIERADHLAALLLRRKSHAVSA
jgi:citrate lyase subunit beta/citryl-CoA lyase